MSDVFAQRPTFFEGQYLGADDLEALLTYLRERHARHMLATGTWGIAEGLGLAQQESPDGSQEVYLEPGYAFDGYGRPLVLMHRKKLDAGMFSRAPNGLVEVWIRYRELDWQGLRQGFEACGATDGFERVAETLVIEIGPRNGLAERQGGITVDDFAIEDAREVYKVLDESAHYLCDGSVPHQAFPEEENKARWLVPVGLVNWKTGLPGGFEPMDAARQRESRKFRRQIGAVAESLYAANGLIRLRPRSQPEERDGDGNPVTSDVHCNASNIQIGDFDDAEQTPVFNELVWIEGHLRVEGDARLFGSRLEFRNDKGTDDDAPLYLQRDAEKPDLNLVLGRNDGKETDDNRLVVTEENDSGEKPVRAVITDSGKVGLGTDRPEAYAEEARELVIAGGAKKGITIEATSHANIRFAKGTGNAVSQLGGLTYSFDDDSLSFRTDSADQLWIDAEGNLGVGTHQPSVFAGVADDLVVRRSGNAGISIASGPSSRGSLVFGNVREDDESEPGETEQGFIRYQHNDDSMRIGTGGSVRIRIDDDGLMSLGDETPRAKLHVFGGNDLGLSASSAYAVFGSTGNRNLALGNQGIQARNAANVTTLELQPKGGALTIHGDSSGSSDRVAVASDGSVAIGISAPTCKLHVRDSINDAASQLNAHVALIENSNSGGNADVLALKVATSNPGTSNNFITFFGGSSAVGSIEVNASGNVAFNTSGADFAEQLPVSEISRPLEAGDLVGVKGGRIGLNTEDADHVLVISDRAGFVGNCVMDDSDRASSAQVALLGQVPVKVTGPVSIGDLLMPSGLNDGSAVAFRDDLQSLPASTQIVGRAWEASKGSEPSRVMAGVNLNCDLMGDFFVERFRQQQKEIESLRKDVLMLKKTLGTG